MGTATLGAKGILNISFKNVSRPVLMYHHANDYGSQVRAFELTQNAGPVIEDLAKLGLFIHDMSHATFFEPAHANEKGMYVPVIVSKNW